MKQIDSMFIQKNETGNVYHLCYTDNTRETISRARFVELSRLATYDPEDGVYWFYSNKSGLAQTPQDAPKTHDSKKVVTCATLTAQRKLTRHGRRVGLSMTCVAAVGTC